MSLVVVPIATMLPLGSIADSVTGTPVALVGFAWFSNKYSIHRPMLASEIAGVPCKVKSKLKLSLRLPVVVWSVTVPVIITLDPNAGTVCGVETAVSLGPGPIQFKLEKVYNFLYLYAILRQDR